MPGAWMGTVALPPFRPDEQSWDRNNEAGGGAGEGTLTLHLPGLVGARDPREGKGTASDLHRH